MSAGSGVKIVLTAHGASERGIEVVPEGTKEKKGSKRYERKGGKQMMTARLMVRRGRPTEQGTG
jgi:hypothetical protein